MGSRDYENDAGEERRRRSGPIGGFIRSLVSGIPWSESAAGEQILHLEVPQKNILHVHNGNGRTSIIGEERDDVEVTATKQAHDVAG